MPLITIRATPAEYADWLDRKKKRTWKDILIAGLNAKPPRTDFVTYNEVDELIRKRIEEAKRT